MTDVFQSMTFLESLACKDSSEHDANSIHVPHTPSHTVDGHNLPGTSQVQLVSTFPCITKRISLVLTFDRGSF